MSSVGVDISTNECTGRVLDHGAQLVAWCPRGSADVIWLSAHAIDAPGSAIRGGVPICFPWFGSGRSGSLSPAHGFARTSMWLRESVREDSGCTTVLHALSSEQVSSAEFPHPYRAIATARLGEDLTVSVEVVNTGAVAFTFEIALHAYFVVGDVTTVRIEGLDGRPYFDKVLGHQAVQTGDVRFSGEVDRVYTSEGPVRLVDPSLERVIVVSKRGSASTVVWNPWIDRARDLSDFGDDEWRSMVCIETANVGDQSVSLAPGESHLIEMAVRVCDP